MSGRTFCGTVIAASSFQLQVVILVDWVGVAEVEAGFAPQEDNDQQNNEIYNTYAGEA